MGLFFKDRKREQRDRKPTAKVVAFLNQKGGVGKTTMAFNTACALANKGHKVLCLDMDPQANLSLLCGVDADREERYSLYHLLINSVRELAPLHVPAMVQDVLIKGKVDLLPSSQELSGFELSVAGINSPRQLILKKFIEKNMLDEQYDYIVIDSPPTLGLLVVNILCASNGVMVPFRPDEFSRKGLTHFYEVLADIEDMGLTDTPQVLAHIPNLVDIRRKQEESDLDKITDELATEFGSDKVVMPFYNRAPLVKSQAQRKSVYDFSSHEFKLLQEQFDHLAGIIDTWKEEHSHGIQ